ncbi:ACP S-malonyltransferase [Periweissella fabalis]|uniref:Malonyl CoA-acyl carrier protein transacylase n=1 Tax=Periweissella fabalis TaxID=1070421 RepID=A0A7X6N1Q7_9LACO|nr:ACP S-malonyltransferase [Periweissella fabalis]MCM0598552.1 ACP S-malonyltransferase [Periweissella fabalis]NKZ24166.1 ACP S-malonyltransferase [Periweissella fabalis]
MPVGFLFGGQGGQNVNMSAHLYENFPKYRAIIDLSSTVLGYDVLAKLQDEAALKTTKYTQPLVVAHSFGLYEVAKDQFTAPTAVLGLSLGEYTALIASGALDFVDGLRLVAKRGQLMQDAVEALPGTMAAVMTEDFALVENVLAHVRENGEQVFPANYNSGQQLVIGGSPVGVEQATAALIEAGIKRVIPLNVAGAFHTPLLEAAQADFADVLATIEFKQPMFTVFSNTTKTPFDLATIKQVLVDQLVNPTFFAQDLALMAEQGIMEFVEFGPDNTLTKFARKTVKDSERTSIFDFASLQKVMGEEYAVN